MSLLLHLAPVAALAATYLAGLRSIERGAAKADAAAVAHACRRL